MSVLTSTRMPKTSKQIAGYIGEQAAVEWLCEQGFSIIDRNWRCGKYEIDIIARKSDEIHFVEVRNRGTFSWETPEQSFDRRKENSFRRAVEMYLSVCKSTLEPKLDFIAVDSLPDGSLDVRYFPYAVISRW